MTEQLSLHLKKFNSMVQTMNQTNQKQLVLSANDARNLQADIFSLLSHCANLSKRVQDNQVDNVVTVAMDGGSFK
jgi:hypothetical protein